MALKKSCDIGLSQKTSVSEMFEGPLIFLLYHYYRVGCPPNLYSTSPVSCVEQDGLIAPVEQPTMKKDMVKQLKPKQFQHF